MKMFTE